jgi:hypothetical protein
MQNLNVKRQELKYYINSIEAERMRSLFNATLLKDEYSSNNNEYTVSSLYFENYDDKNLDEKLDGILSRKKYRIRIYNKDLSVIKLENKIKENNTISKISTVISKEDSINLCNCNFNNFKNTDDVFFRMINYLNIFKYRPKVIIEYQREAFYLPYNNIRITFDKHLSTYNNYTDINNIKKGVSFPVINENMITLEVKFNNELPIHIKNLLSIIPASRASIGKYVLGQRFMNYNDWRDPLTSIS